MKKKNIALIGFMGTGKSTIGRSLADKLDMKFIEMDEIIEQKANKSIPEIFREGEIIFRELEMNVCKEVSKYENCVISTGGGVVLNKLNIDYLKESSLVILLEAPAKNIYDRIMKEGKEKRPVINKPDPLSEIRKTLVFRKPFYDIAADFTVNTINKTMNQIIQEIIDFQDPTSYIHQINHTSSQIDLLSAEKILLNSTEKKKCLICNNVLITLEKPDILKCSLCKKERYASKICSKGHFVCNRCFIQDFEEMLLEYIHHNSLINPIEIFKEIKNLLHYDEINPPCAMIVCTSLLLGLKNCVELQIVNQLNKIKQISTSQIIIGIKRSIILPSHMDAYFGIPQAIIGLGIVFSIFFEITPKKMEQLPLYNDLVASLIRKSIHEKKPEEQIEIVLDTGMVFFQNLIDAKWSH